MKESLDMIIFTLLLFSAFYLIQINRMTFALVTSREIPEEKHQKIFRTINILITLLLVTFYVELVYAV